MKVMLPGSSQVVLILSHCSSQKKMGAAESQEEEVEEPALPPPLPPREQKKGVVARGAHKVHKRTKAGATVAAIQLKRGAHKVHKRAANSPAGKKAKKTARPTGMICMMRCCIGSMVTFAVSFCCRNMVTPKTTGRM